MLHRSEQFGDGTSSGSTVKGLVPARVPKREVEKRIILATSQPHGSKRSSGAVRGHPGAVSGRPGPSGAASEAGFDVLPVYRDLRQFPKGKPGAVLNLNRAKNEGNGAEVASTFGLGLVARFWAEFPKGKSESRGVSGHGPAMSEPPGSEQF